MMVKEKTESMVTYYDNCASNYDQHSLNDLGMKEIYDDIEQQISACKYPKHILVLGCGTGLEIERIQHKAIITAVDISEEMLKRLKQKTLNENIKLRMVHESFLNVMFTKDKFDLILSTRSFHYFTAEQKLKLYRQIYYWLKPTGYFINCDMIAKNKEQELTMRKNAEAIYKGQEQEFGSLHIDTPLNIESEEAILREAGFAQVSMPRRWTATVMFKAEKLEKRVSEEAETDLEAKDSTK